MIEKVVGDLKLPKLSSPQHKNRVMRLLWIQGIDTNLGKNQFRTLFKDIHTGMYLTELLWPEFLRYYSVGSCYRDSKLVKDQPPLGDIINLQVTSTGNNDIRKISEALTDEEYSLRHSFEGKKGLIDYTAENKRQHCVVFEDHSHVAIFPCAVIGAAYYFTSSSMREQIFTQNLEGLYERVSLNPETKEARIRMKPGALYADYKHIVRFATDEYAKRRWLAVRNDMARIKNILAQQNDPASFVPFMSDFPVRQVLNMRVRGLKFSDKETGREKILVLRILKEDSSFGFEKVIIEKRGKKPPSSEAKGIKPSKALQTTDKLKNETPSAHLGSVYIRNEEEDTNINTGKIEAEVEYLEGEAAESHGTYESKESKIDLAIMEPRSSGDDNIRHGEVIPAVKSPREEIPEKIKESSSMEDFIRMIEIMTDVEGVSELAFHGPEFMPYRYQDGSNSLRETYDGNIRNRRQYMYATLTYEGRNIAVIEIDQTNLPNGSSIYILISQAGGISGEDVISMLKLYVRQRKMEEISKELGKNGIAFTYKKHPIAKEERHYKRWCEDILMKIADRQAVVLRG